jgi:hypothetical protein
LSEVPPPLTPADCDLQDFEFMPVMVRRLLKSETWSLGNGDERAAAVALWFESWHQVPAASLPENDRLLRKLADSEKWSKVKAQALRGWIRCSDARLYHPVVAEKALEAWVEKLLNSISGSAGNAKRWGVAIDTSADVERLRLAVSMLRVINPKSKSLNKKALLTIIATQSPPDVNEGGNGVGVGDSPPDSPQESPPDRKGQGQGQGQGSSSVPIGTGGKPPKLTDPKEIIFGYGLALLVNAGTPEKQARSFLGGRVKEHGEWAVVDALGECAKNKPLQPLEWLAAALPPLSAGKSRPNSQEALEAANADVVRRVLEKEKAHENQ